jgi:RNA polymerase sigma-70 factor (ECF subfamily)
VAELFGRHAPAARLYFRRCGFSPADADDLAQETFVRVQRSLGTFDPARGSGGAWIAAIARNVARAAWHKRSPAAAHLDEQLAEAAFEVAQSPEAQEEIRELDDCVSRLPAELAAIVRLRYVEGLTTRGIAQRRGLPEATVRLRLQEAHQALERCMKGKGILE